MPRILGADDIWCQLFSEPDAGSDLAALSTRAEKRGGVYRVNGQKVWSSYATFADMGIALVRTDPTAPPHKGISMLAIPMDAPGVDVRPLRQITGDSEFNEVFFDDVEVPVENLIGPETRRLARREHDARQRTGRVVHLEGAGAPAVGHRRAGRGVSRASAQPTTRACANGSRSRGSTSRSSVCTTLVLSPAWGAARRSARSRAS